MTKLKIIQIKRVEENLRWIQLKVEHLETGHRFWLGVPVVLFSRYIFNNSESNKWKNKIIELKELENEH